MECKSQSAMEYLMTYGWAILIIAVVLTVLFQMGIFSAGNFQPHAQAGSCQVSRTVAGVSLEGQCNGLLPEFVMQVIEPQSGGSPAYIKALNSPSLTISTTGNMTISIWVNVVSQTTGHINEFYAAGFDDNYDTGQIRDSNYNIEMVRGANQEMFAGYNLGQWYNFIGTYTYNGVGGNVYLYRDGAYIGGGPAGTGTATTSNVIIGVLQNLGAITEIQFSNLQIYNTTLSPSEVNAIYLSGIGGAPTRPQNLVGWWPLNGNANDYSGNGNNGQAYGSVTYSSAWESGYTAP